MCALRDADGGAALHRSTAQAIIAKRISDPVPSARRLRATVPNAADAALKRALAKTAVDRFPTATEFVEALFAGDAEPDVSPAMSIVVLPFVRHHRLADSEL